MCVWTELYYLCDATKLFCWMALWFFCWIPLTHGLCWGDEVASMRGIRRLNMFKYCKRWSESGLVLRSRRLHTRKNVQTSYNEKHNGAPVNLAS